MSGRPASGSLLTRMLAAALALGFAITSLPPAAVAQERRTLLQMLFGKKPKKASAIEEIQLPRTTRPRTRKRTTPTTATAAAATAEQQQPVVKLETARKILVVGDFLASGLGDGLTAAFSASPGVVVENRNNVASGLVRDDYFDWQVQLPAYIDAVKPAMVVVLIGANDRQQMTIGSTREKFRTEAWLSEYEARAARLASAVTAKGLPLLWVGLPAFQSPSMTADAVQLNGMYRTQTEKAGGEFIDIWDGFVDENGKFIVTGSDINGQQVRLRSSDGLNLTRAGRRKLAFYIEKSAKRLLGDTAASADPARLDTISLPAIVSLPPAEKEKIVRTQPISLVDPDLDGGQELLGSQTLPAIITQSSRNLLIEKGEVEPAPTGRVDDYHLMK